MVKTIIGGIFCIVLGLIGLTVFWIQVLKLIKVMGSLSLLLFGIMLICKNFNYRNSQPAKSSLKKVKEKQHRTVKPDKRKENKHAINRGIFRYHGLKIGIAILILSITVGGIAIHYHKIRKEREELADAASVLVVLYAAGSFVGAIFSGLGEIVADIDFSDGSPERTFNEGRSRDSIFSFGESKEYWETCPKCYGSGRLDVILGDGREIERTCNICNGRGKIRR